MANNDNLIPFNAMTTGRHREISRLGGIASGKARRQKRDLKELIISEDRVQNELARSACSILLEASNLLVESTRYSNTVCPLEYSPTTHKFRLSKTEAAAERNFKQLTDGHKLDYVLISVAESEAALQKMISRDLNR